MSPNSTASVHARPNDDRARLRETALAPISDPARTEALRAAGPGCAWWGAVRLPLTLGRTPAAHLLGAPGEALQWWVRLPDGTGSPAWCHLSGETLERWARDSGYPALASEIRTVERRAHGLAEEVD